MGLFNNRNANEDAYVGGKKHWVDVIKNSGDEDMLIWRQPEEDFNTNSTLIVMPGEEAIFVNNGSIEQVFTNGSYKLSTQNYPFISRLRNYFSGGVSVFNCVVFFVRTAYSKEIKWGTMKPIEYYDDQYQQLNIKGFGAYKVKVNDPKVFLDRMVGSNIEFKDADDLDEFFANEFFQHISDTIVNALDSLKESLGQPIYKVVSGHKAEIGSTIGDVLGPILAKNGLKLENFSVSHLKVEGATPEIQKAIDTAMQMGVMSSAKVNEGWQAMTQRDIMTNLSNNPGGGGMASAGMGVGMGIGAMGMMGNMMGCMMQGGMMGQPQQQQPQPQPTAPAADDPMAKLQKLKQMLDMGLISQQDFDAKKQDIINSI